MLGVAYNCQILTIQFVRHYILWITHLTLGFHWQGTLGLYVKTKDNTFTEKKSRQFTEITQRILTTIKTKGKGYFVF